MRNVIKFGFIFNLINRAEIKGEKILCKFLDQNSVQVFLFFLTKLLTSNIEYSILNFHYFKRANEKLSLFDRIKKACSHII